eukprot:GHVS01043088.1.p1 GENE.GHVS01043088.1~~GHVS01043088.1.p1  ORF type:complete len:711 (-),score=217.05 GHVS01043088.1:257-2389(-)
MDDLLAVVGGGDLTTTTNSVLLLRRPLRVLRATVVVLNVIIGLTFFVSVFLFFLLGSPSSHNFAQHVSIPIFISLVICLLFMPEKTLRQLLASFLLCPVIISFCLFIFLPTTPHPPPPLPSALPSPSPSTSLLLPFLPAILPHFSLFPFFAVLAKTGCFSFAPVISLQTHLEVFLVATRMLPSLPFGPTHSALLQGCPQRGEEEDKLVELVDRGGEEGGEVGEASRRRKRKRARRREEENEEAESTIDDLSQLQQHLQQQQQLQQHLQQQQLEFIDFAVQTNNTTTTRELLASNTHHQHTNTISNVVNISNESTGGMAVNRYEEEEEVDDVLLPLSSTYSNKDHLQTSLLYGSPPLLFTLSPFPAGSTPSSTSSSIATLLRTLPSSLVRLSSFPPHRPPSPPAAIPPPPPSSSLNTSSSSLNTSSSSPLSLSSSTHHLLLPQPPHPSSSFSAPTFSFKVRWLYDGTLLLMCLYLLLLSLLPFSLLQLADYCPCGRLRLRLLFAIWISLDVLLLANCFFLQLNNTVFVCGVLAFGASLLQLTLHLTYFANTLTPVSQQQSGGYSGGWWRWWLPQEGEEDVVVFFQRRGGTERGGISWNFAPPQMAEDDTRRVDEERGMSPMELMVVDSQKLSPPTPLPNDICSICHEDFVYGDTVSCLPPCRHAYHTICLRHWLSRRALCPNCSLNVRIHYNDVYRPVALPAVGVVVGQQL